MVVASYEVSLFKNDNNNWKDIGNESYCRALLKENEDGRLVLVFKQASKVRHPRIPHA